MLPKKRFALLVLYAALLAVGYCATGCAKEYSYEGSPTDSVRVMIDTMPPSPPFLSTCAACVTTGSLPDSSWQFNVGTALLCGRADKAIITLERTSFTFFGPSACSADSGFVASVYLTDPLTTNQVNVHAARVAFYYYDGITPSYVLVSQNTSPFSLTITSYNHLTHTAIGTFSGATYTVGGLRKEVTNGRFSIKF